MNQEQPRILIADDEPLFRETTAEFLREENYQCVCVENADDAIDVLKEHAFDLILTDLNMPGNLKLELLTEGRTRYSHIPMIVITGVPSVPSAIESVRLGIADYLLKPVKLEELLVAVQRALSGSVSASANHLRSHEPADSDAEDRQPKVVATEDGENSDQRWSGVVGESGAMRNVMQVVARVAAGKANVLVTGESGTGKEVIARAIHQHSARQQHPFQVIDCTAIPESLFESVLFGHVKGSFTGAVKDQAGLLRASDGGTAFFDELGELPAASQAKLLRFIQSQSFTPVGDSRAVQVDTRFVSATNRNLSAEVDAGRFRQDLYYRLAVIHIELPPLRRRGEDVVLLANAFLKDLRPKGSRLVGFSKETLDCFRLYQWPGNIRELRNVVERSVTLAEGDWVHPDDLPEPLRNAQSDSEVDDPDLMEIARDEALDRADRLYLTTILEKHQGVIARAARQAGLSRQGMHKLLRRHNIDVDDFRAS